MKLKKKIKKLFAIEFMEIFSSCVVHLSVCLLLPFKVLTFKGEECISD